MKDARISYNYIEYAITYWYENESGLEDVYMKIPLIFNGLRGTRNIRGALYLLVRWWSIPREDAMMRMSFGVWKHLRPETLRWVSKEPTTSWKRPWKSSCGPPEVPWGWRATQWLRCSLEREIWVMPVRVPISMPLFSQLSSNMLWKTIQKTPVFQKGISGLPMTLFTAAFTIRIRWLSCPYFIRVNSSHVQVLRATQIKMWPPVSCNVLTEWNIIFKVLTIHK